MFIQTSSFSNLRHWHSKKISIFPVKHLFINFTYILLKYLYVTPEIIISILVLFKFIMLIVRIKLTNALIQIPISKYVKNVLIPSIQCLTLSLIIPLAITLLYPASLTSLLYMLNVITKFNSNYIYMWIYL